MKKGKRAGLIKQENKEADTSENSEVVEDTLYPVKKLKTSLAPQKLTKQQQKQLKIQLEIENENTMQKITEMSSKFEPSECIRCKNRLSEKICVCNRCLPGEQLSLICGKCHIESHSLETDKPELNVQEFFVKIGEFMCDTRSEMRNYSAFLDTEYLEASSKLTTSFKSQINQIKNSIQELILNYMPPEGIEDIVCGSFTKIISEPSFENVQNQLLTINSYVDFNGNDFEWIQEKESKFLSQQQSIIQKNIETSKQFILNSFTLGKQIAFKDNSILVALEKANQQLPEIITNPDGSQTIQKVSSNRCQVFINYQLDRKKKYTVRFQLHNQPHLAVGVMQRQYLKTNCIGFSTLGPYCKRFNSFSYSEKFNCNKVIKGEDFGNLTKAEQQIEMRFCIEEGILEFITFPDYKNAVTRQVEVNYPLTDDNDNVVVFGLQTNQKITITYFEETFEFPPYD